MRLALASALLLLAACQQEPSFEERYEAAQKQVGAKASDIAADMRKADQQAAADRRQLEAAKGAVRKQAGAGR